MTDRELLERAAKAIGIKHRPENNCVVVDAKTGQWLGSWNPLTDDGDALRLAVKLDMQIWRNAGGTVSAMPPKGVIGFWDRLQDDLEPDPYAATRRAIVRAAAEIGIE